MGMKDDMLYKLRMATSDKQDLNKQALRVHKSLKEVEKALGINKKDKK